MYKLYCYQSMFTLYENREKFCFGLFQIGKVKGNLPLTKIQRYPILEGKKNEILKNILQITSVPKETW